MTYTFEGKQYVTLADWLREYPIYKHYTDLLKSGVRTVEGMTKEIYKRRENSRKAALKNSGNRGAMFNKGKMK